jgi:hypothetical protein
LESRRVLTAGLIAYEGFDYAAGSLAGQGGGSGFSGTWSVVNLGGAAVESGSLAHTGLTSAGNKLHLWSTTGSTCTATRSLGVTNPVGAANGTVWLSLVADKDSTSRDLTVSFDGLAVRASGGGNWTVKTPNTAYVASTTPGTTQAMFLVRVDFTSTTDTAYVWINPTLGSSAPSTATANFTIADATGFTFDSVSIACGPFGSSAQGGKVDELRVADTYTAAVGGTTAMSQTYWYGDLETGTTAQFSGTEGQAGGRSVVTSVEGQSPRDGTYALKNYIQKAVLDGTSTNKRSEAFRYNLGNPGAPGDEWWYGFSFFIPTTWVDDPGETMIIMQMHIKPDTTIGEGWRTPFFNLNISGTTLQVQSWSDPTANSGSQATLDANGGKGPNFVGHTGSLGTVAKGVWTDVVLHAKWDYRTTGPGLLEVFKNGSLSYTQSGGNCYNDTENQMYIKTGIYMPGYDSADAASYTIYHDEVRAAQGGAGYSAVAPQGARANRAGATAAARYASPSTAASSRKPFAVSPLRVVPVADQRVIDEEPVALV